MSRRFLSLAVIALAVICFIAGWLSYEWVLHRVTASTEQPIITITVQEAFNHRLMTSLSFALVGAITAFGGLLSGRFSAGYRYGRSLLILLLVAALSVSSWVVVLTKKIASFSEHLAAVPGFAQPSLLLSQVRLHEIGIFGSGCVLAMAILLTLISIGRSRKVSNKTSKSMA